MTNTILVKKNEIALNGLADNKREFIARDGKKKDFFDVEDLNGELYHSKVINPGLFQQAPQVGLQNGVAYACVIGEGPGDGGGGGDSGGDDCDHPVEVDVGVHVGPIGVSTSVGEICADPVVDAAAGAVDDAADGYESGDYGE
jgi:hypothetical protein